MGTLIIYPVTLVVLRDSNIVSKKYVIQENFCLAISLSLGKEGRRKSERIVKKVADYISLKKA